MTDTEGDDVTHIAVPRRVLEHLEAGFVGHEAHDLLNRLIDHGYTEGDVVHVGDPFGAVLAWEWTEEPSHAALLMADFMGVLRHHDALVGEGCPRVRFDDVLGSLGLAMPNGFSQTAELIEYLRESVPGYFRSDLNS